MSKDMHKNPFMKKVEDKPKNDRWSNLNIEEETPENKFKTVENYDDNDDFRRKNKFISDNMKPRTSQNFRLGETFNYSLQFGDITESNHSFNHKKSSSFMKFTKPRTPTPPPEFNIDNMVDEFPGLA